MEYKSNHISALPAVWEWECCSWLQCKECCSCMKGLVMYDSAALPAEWKWECCSWLLSVTESASRHNGTSLLPLYHLLYSSTAFWTVYFTVYSAHCTMHTAHGPWFHISSWIGCQPAVRGLCGGGRREAVVQRYSAVVQCNLVTVQWYSTVVQLTLFQCSGTVVVVQWLWYSVSVVLNSSTGQ